MAEILLVEDDKAQLHALARLLTSRGYRVRGFDTVAGAFESAVSEPPDLVVADVGLKGESGLDLVSRLRQALPDAMMRIVIVSGRVSEDDYLRGFAAGADDYLGKPFDANELLAKCAVHLARTHSGRVEATVPPVDVPGGKERAFGRFRLDRVLGKGASGVVYQAWDLLREGWVSLKILSPLACSSPEARLRFQREILALSRVRSGNVARFVEAEEHEGRWFLAAEFVAGTTLREAVLAHGPLPPGKVRALLVGLADALVDLDAAGLIHRDIKPSNVVLRDGSPERPVLIDLGLAKPRFGRGLTLDGSVAGTPGYIAPERIRDEQVDGRCDQFSVGATAVFALTGKEPFPGLSPSLVIYRMAQQRLPIPDASDAALQQVVKRLTELDQAERFPSAEAFAQAVSVWRRGVNSRPAEVSS